MVSTASDSSPRDRILATAMDLFYRHGYNATGINQIIAEANVAKASFYDHFPSKEDLLVAYASEMARQEIAMIREDVRRFSSARERFFAPLQMLKPWFDATGYRGCPFQNVVVECPPGNTGVQEVARQHRESIRALFQELVLDLKHSEPAYRHLDAEAIVDLYLLLFEGALALSVAYRATWPIDKAITILTQTVEA